MSFVVQKDPIKVIDLSLPNAERSGNPNNFPDNQYLKLDTVPVGVPDKYLKLVGGILTEKTAEEKAVVDGADLIATKQAKWAEIEAKANAEVDDLIGGERGKGYVNGHTFLKQMDANDEGLLSLEQQTVLQQTLIAVRTKAKAKYAIIMDPNISSVDEVKSIVW